MDGGWGYHFTPEKLEELDLMDWGSLFGRVPGVYWVYGGMGGDYVLCQPSAPSLERDGPDKPVIVVDGFRIGSRDALDIPIRQVAAVEIYRGGVSTPIEFSGRGCTIVIWTKN